MTLPPSPGRRKLRMVRDGSPPDDLVLLIRATPSTIAETVRDIAESALDSADTYVVDHSDVGRVVLYGVSVFARQPGTEPAELLGRFAASPRYLETSVGAVRSAGFGVLPTGPNPAHFDVLLIGDRTEPEGLLSLEEVELTARRLVAVCGHLRLNPSYAGRLEDEESP